MPGNQDAERLGAVGIATTHRDNEWQRGGHHVSNFKRFKSGRRGVGLIFMSFNNI
jgi:hypothetical protein